MSDTAKVTTDDKGIVLLLEGLEPNTVYRVERQGKVEVGLLFVYSDHARGLSIYLHHAQSALVEVFVYLPLRLA